MRVRVEGLTRVFGTLRAVDGLTFTLDEGEVWGFIGPNGAGKTTTLRMLATVDQPTEGDAWINGCSVVRDAGAVRPMLGFVPDFFGSYPDMFVNEYLDFFARAYGLRGPARRSRLAEIVEFVELEPLMAKRVTDLSKGMQQRISLARALVHDPEFLLLDEPAAGLDPHARRDLRELLRLLGRRGKTVFVSSHILSELEDLIDKVLIINEGKLAYAGDPKGHEASEPAGEFTLQLRVAGDLEQCTRLLLEAPSVRRVHTQAPDGLRVLMSGGKAEIAELIRRLVAAKQVPYQVAMDRRPLESVFLEMTGRENRENNDAS